MNVCGWPLRQGSLRRASLAHGHSAGRAGGEGFTSSNGSGIGMDMLRLGSGPLAFEGALDLREQALSEHLDYRLELVAGLVAGELEELSDP